MLHKEHDRSQKSTNHTWKYLISCCNVPIRVHKAVNEKISEIQFEQFQPDEARTESQHKTTK